MIDNRIKAILGVNLDDIYVMKPCSCTSISAELFELSGKVEDCCLKMSIALSDISVALSDVYKKIDDLSGKIADISSKISAEEPPPATIFAYNAEDAEVTALLEQKDVWNTEPFPGYISSADTELMTKLSSVMHFDFPSVVELNNYNHAWDSETINVGSINYCSYSKIPFEGIIVPDSELCAGEPIVWDDEKRYDKQYEISVDSNCLLGTRIIPIDPTFDEEIPEEYLQQLKVYGKFRNSRIYFEPSYSIELKKDGKRYLGLTFAPNYLDPWGYYVNEFKYNTTESWMDYPIYAAKPMLFNYSVDDDFKYELVLTANTMKETSIWGKGQRVPPTIYES